MHKSNLNIVYTVNTTFVCDPKKEMEMISFLKEEIIPKIIQKNNSFQNPIIRKVVEVGGLPPEPDHGLSIALSVAFPTKEDARVWQNSLLLPQLEKIHERFGNQVLYFITLLENC